VGALIGTLAWAPGSDIECTIGGDVYWSCAAERPARTWPAHRPWATIEAARIATGRRIRRRPSQPCSGTSNDSESTPRGTMIMYPLPRKIIRVGLPSTETLRSGSRPPRGLCDSVG
jgi:hypothetical protein